MNTNLSTALLRKLPRLSGSTAWLLGWLLLAAWFGCGREWLKHNPAPAQAAFRARPSALASQPKLDAVAISQMRVGDQVPADNPTGEKDTEFGDTVDPPNWRKLVLLAPKKDGSTADVELLRPLWWLEEQQAEVGGTVDIQVPECGIEGRAEVLAIEPCPPIQPRPGLRVVTGTFKHRASQVLDMYVEGLDEPIGTTPNHPFWSEDRQTFVRADELKQGEHLRAFNGTPIVRRVVPLAAPEPVFNLEVQCDHVYHVARSGVHVHNSFATFLLDTDVLVALEQGVQSAISLVRSGNVSVLPEQLAEFLNPTAISAEQIALRESLLARHGIDVFDDAVARAAPKFQRVYDATVRAGHSEADAVLGAMARATGREAITTERRLAHFFTNTMPQLGVPIRRLCP
jgi:hypothetical protein